LINCGEVILVTAAYKDKATITTCAWHLPLSRSPAALGIALAKTHFSSELIKKSGEFIVNIPDWSLLDKVMLCGSLSGRALDKFKEAKLTPQKPHHLVKTYAVKECIAHLECSLLDLKEIGDHFLFLGEIVYAQAESEFFVNDFWDTAKVNLIFHLGSKFFFKSSPYIEYKK
jgi:flavin reductase (DIM6/NTAB) family NADH-FMN oxidoreductase RutF